MRKFTNDDYHEWPGADNFVDRPESDDAPRLGEIGKWILVASEGMVGLYPAADPKAGYWIAYPVGFKATMALAWRVERLPAMRAKALVALGFEREDEIDD